MGRAARRPLAVSLIVGLLAVAGGALALARLQPSAATDTLVGRGTAELRRHRAPAPALRRRRRLRPHPPAAHRDDADLGPAPRARPRGLPLGQRAEGPGAARRARTGRARGSRGRSRSRSSSGPGRSSTRPSARSRTSSSAQSAAKAAQADRAAKAARALARSQGRSEKEARKLGEQAKQLVLAEFVRNTLQLALKYGITSAPQLNDPSFVSRIVFDPNRPAGHAEGALRLHLPGEGQRADPGPPAPRPHRGRSATTRSR